MSMTSFIVDVEKCSGCGLCVVACKDEHVGSAYEPWTKPQPATGHFWMNLRSYETGKIPKVSVSHMPTMCQHCANAPCMKVCAENAINRRDDGLVWIDQDLCTGSGLCQEACPYDVIYMNAEIGVAQKCTGCAHRVDEGLLPRCVGICPHGAILFGDETGDVMIAAAANGDPLEVYHSEFNADPRVLWKGLPRRIVSGTVIDRDTNDVIQDVDVAVRDLFYDQVVSTVTDAFGDFWLRHLESDRKYQLTVKKVGYGEQVRVLSTDSDRDLGEVVLVRTD
ncbi:MAG TPA: 4Fe-4S dicluster domain-containing protein [Acidimicrobiia bacterium]|nr:4Fe-4S dicluster domain-containing protein [Acidimicrobiia bacterium]